MTWELDTQRILNFDITHTPDDNDEDFHYLDIAQMLSAVNRQSFRQGMTYDVANMVFHDSASTETFISVCTVPNTWATQAAWSEGLFQWLRQQHAALNATNLDDFGPWHDFKCYFNYDHIADIDKATFVDTEGNTLTPGEWIYSNYIVPEQGSGNAETALIGLMGAHVGTPQGADMTYASLLEVLENTINQPAEDPDLPAGVATSLWQQLSADQPDVETITKIIADMAEDNDFPPYSGAVIPGAGAAGAGRPSGPWRQRLACIQGGANHMAAVGGFQAPCGLIVLDTKQASSDTIGVQIELVPGDYKGVSARKMRRPSKGGFDSWQDRLMVGR